jgi:hypothetical protein
MQLINLEKQNILSIVRYGATKVSPRYALPGAPYLSIHLFLDVCCNILS